LRLRVVPSDAWVRSDPILLERILLNLVSNAVRYTDHGGVLVGARRRGGLVRIEVRDSGVGIPSDQTSKVFGEFYQLASPERGHRGGLGLGLAIVDRLCRLLGHPVELASAPGRGSCFAVSLPPVSPQHKPVEPSTATLGIADPATGKLIVVIDDDRLVLDGMRGVLQSWGCFVVAAESDGAALASLDGDDRRPDLIISDYRLADGMTGIRAVERLRKAFRAPIPAFLISGDTAPERLLEARAQGFHLLHKPVAPMALRAMVNQLLKANRVDGAPRMDGCERSPSDRLPADPSATHLLQ
jgi:CheY-like chemotaxis protein